jgi:2-polyprenyl-3-methyl-5-hydroxy-6-metoxy-1,4-benzoquinol methylase
MAMAYKEKEHYAISNNKEFLVNKKIIQSREVKFGPRMQNSYLEDPKHLLFNLSRYKFVSKMFTGYKNVLEIGCGDAFGTALVAQTVEKLTATDLDKKFIIQLKKTHGFSNKIDFLAKDFIREYIEEYFDAAFCLDVLEHIPKKFEKNFISNITKSLSNNGDLIIGMPSLESQVYASKLSKEGHVNCKKAKELKELMLCYFSKVFIFSMNDEVLHTGFEPMSHYIFALCVAKK